jgi:hypothetical protein
MLLMRVDVEESQFPVKKSRTKEFRKNFAFSLQHINVKNRFRRL